MTRWRENLRSLWGSFHPLGSWVKERSHQKSSSVPRLKLPLPEEPVRPGQGGVWEGCPEFTFHTVQGHCVLLLRWPRGPRKVWNLIPGSQEEPWEQNFKQTDEVLSEISGLSLPIVELFGKTSHLFVNSHWGVLKAPTLSTFKGRVVLGKIADSRVFGVRGCCHAWPPIPEFPRCEDCPISDCGQIIA